MSTFLSYVLYLVRHGTWTAIFCHMSSIQFVMGHRQLFFCHMSSIQFVMGHRQAYLLYMFDLISL